MTQIFLTSGTTWTVPTDWNNSNNSIECLGGGGGGSSQNNGASSSGASGGGYGKVSNITLTPSSTVNYAVGVGGTAGNAGLGGGNGGDTYFNAASYAAATVAGQHGLGSQGTATYAGGSGKGTTVYSGGGTSTGNNGGGGAAGLNGNGNGSSGNNGGSGDAGFGGAGGARFNNGGNGTEWDSTHGSGGGGGGNGNPSGNGGSYGAGGGSSGSSVITSGAGSQGIIVINYTTVDVGDRYWVGGTANWDALSTSNWAYVSGGTTGASVPTSSNQVFFDANSGNGTVTVTATANCSNLNLTGYTGTFAGSSTLNCAGNLTLSSGMTNSYTGAFTMTSTTIGKTVTTSGKTIPAITFNGVGGGWTFQDALNCLGAVTITNGTVNLGSFIHILSSTGTVWSNSGTVNSNTSTIKLTNASSSAKTFAGGGSTYNNLEIFGAGTGAYTITGSNTFNDFKIDTPPHTVNFTASTTQKVSTFTVSGTAGNLNVLQSTSSGTQWGLSSSNQISVDY